MSRLSGQPSKNGDPNTPLQINDIANQLGNYFQKLMNMTLPYNIESNFQVKRKYMYLLASLKKCYYLDLEFPYFKKFKNEKFNWKAFMNQYGSADISTYIEICNKT
jgi:hypothetical protein